MLYRKLLFLLVATTVFTQELAPRAKFSIPLIRLTVKNDLNAPNIKQVRVSATDAQSYALITSVHDEYIENSRKGINKTTYAERQATSNQLSRFEHKQLSKTITSFKKTLKQFQTILKDNNWDKCRYLDSFLPRFLKSFYYLNCASFSSEKIFTPKINFAESLFDVSLTSTKTDKRITKWQNKKDHIIKLRIAVKELIFQLDSWEKNALRESGKKSPILAYSDQFVNAYELFIIMYFIL